jgi:hypothetical protein
MTTRTIRTFLSSHCRAVVGAAGCLALMLYFVCTNVPTPAEPDGTATRRVLVLAVAIFLLIVGEIYGPRRRRETPNGGNPHEQKPGRERKPGRD